MPADGWLVRCPSCDPSKCFVLGGRNRNNQLMYSEYTQICCSSQHAGIISKNGGMVIVVKIHHDINVRVKAITLHNITSKGVYLEDYHYELLPVHSTTSSKPIVSKPSTSKPSTSKPLTSKPSTSIPSTSIPSTSKPSTSKSSTSKPSTTSELPTTTPFIPSTTSKRLIETISIQAMISRSNPLFRETNEQSSNVSGLNPEIIPANNETVLEEFTNDKSDGGMTLLYGILIGFGLSCILCVLVVGVKRLKNRRKQLIDSYRRYHQSIDTSPCVCYVSSNPDAQGLMHDPETCERDCSNKQKQSDAGLNLSKEDCSGDCNDCSVQSCHQKYSF